MNNATKTIYGDGISFSYNSDCSLSLALDGIGVETKAGELIAILGQNGSGKSTLAKHFNALLPLQSGKLIVVGIDSRDKDNTWRLRRLCGMVFQSPDNQFVSSVIGEDVAFGLENYETPRFLIQGKVSSALKAVGMEGYEKRSPHTLSGGQKQRVALAGILALEPDIIVFDEATAMLDPEGRSEILNEIQRIRNQSQKTIVMITHHVEEAVLADRVYLMQKGKMLACGTPREILVDIELMELAGLIPPVPVRMYYDLKAAGILLKSCPLTDDELVEEICQLN